MTVWQKPVKMIVFKMKHADGRTQQILWRGCKKTATSLELATLEETRGKGRCDATRSIHQLSCFTEHVIKGCFYRRPSVDRDDYRLKRNRRALIFVDRVTIATMCIKWKTRYSRVLISYLSESSFDALPRCISRRGIKKGHSPSNFMRKTSALKGVTRPPDDVPDVSLGLQIY